MHPNMVVSDNFHMKKKSQSILEGIKKFFDSLKDDPSL